MDLSDPFIAQNIIGLIVALIAASLGLSYLLAQKTHLLKMADKEIDSLMQKLQLSEDELLIIRNTKNVTERHQMIFKKLNDQIDYLRAKVAKDKEPGATAEKFLADLEYLSGR